MKLFGFFALLTIVVTVKAKGFCKGRKDGNYADPVKCHGFISCVHGITYRRICPGGLKYSQAKQQCTSIKCTGKGFCRGKKEGNYRHPNHCTRFITCSNGIAYNKHCPAGLRYSVKHDRCVHAHNVKCKVISRPKLCTHHEQVFLPGQFIYKCKERCKCKNGRISCLSLCPPQHVHCKFPSIKEAIYVQTFGGCTCKRERCMD